MGGAGDGDHRDGSAQEFTIEVVDERGRVLAGLQIQEVITHQRDGHALPGTISGCRCTAVRMERRT
jgi:hypothetical protein